MNAVADSSPLVILTKLGCLDFLNRVFPRVYISNEVHYEVVVAGAGLPGALEVSKAEWIEVNLVAESLQASVITTRTNYIVVKSGRARAAMKEFAAEVQRTSDEKSGTNMVQGKAGSAAKA